MVKQIGQPWSTAINGGQIYRKPSNLARKPKVEEPKEETPVKEEAETTETVVEESKEETADVVPQETPEPLRT
nr:hypothetical protein [Tanacetum cinerariifolium]